MAVCGLTATSSDVYVRKLLGVLRAFALALLRGPFALIGNRSPRGWVKFEQKGNGLKKSRNPRSFTFFSRSFRFVGLWVLFSIAGSETNGWDDESGFELVSAGSLFTFSKFALEFDGTELVSGECSPAAKTDNLAARSIRALFEGKVRLPLTEVRKGLRSSSIRWRGSPESGAGAPSTDCEWRSSMAWVVGSSRSAVKELAFSGGTVMSRWISSRNWRNSNPFSSGRDRLELDPATIPGSGSIGSPNLFEFN
jgi:hypothetical protein